MNVELFIEFRKQMRFVLGSCRLYDQGNEEEGIRIATAMTMLFNRNGSDRFFQSYFDYDAMQLMSSVTTVAGKGEYTFTDMLKVEMRAMDGGDFKPALQIEKLHPVSFARWWTEEPIFVVRGQEVTRKLFCTWARNNDGGGHTQKINGTYKQIRDGLGWSMGIRADNCEPWDGNC